jgi:ATP-binding cassette subfamily B protein
VGAQRLLPVLQQAYAAWGSVKSGQASLQDTLDLLEQDEPIFNAPPPIQPAPFNSDIRLSNLGFRYDPKLPWIFRGIDLTIKKGERIGLIGPTGEGKSTLLDVLMGLLEPTEGRLEIDGLPVRSDTRRQWQLHVAHVPQSIFIADISVEENVAFGVPKNEIDLERVRLCCRQAQIADLIESWPNQYMTFVGERGMRLSGGQRQRIGIARALYKKADVIIFDEATSALDSETEAAVMTTLESLGENLTIFLIAHRLTTLKMCSRVFELRDGYISSVDAALVAIETCSTTEGMGS